MHYRSYIDLTNLVTAQIKKVPKNVDLIVGIPRSGMIPAYLIAGILDCGVTDFYSFLRNDKIKGGHRYRNEERNAFDYNHILIIDDSINSGSSLEEVKLEIHKSNFSNYEKLQFGVIYVTKFSAHLVDFYFESIPNPRLFEWNIFNHKVLSNSCFDLDGVLCHDVPELFNDDGEKYIDFITHVSPLIRPRVKIDKIITSRLEKYRAYTEKWLAEHQIHYNELIMLDLPDKNARKKWGKHGDYKASVYQNSENVLFFESSIEQALRIAEITGKPVFCVDTKQMINSDKEIHQSQLLAPYGKFRSLLSLLKGKLMK